MRNYLLIIIIIIFFAACVFPGKKEAAQTMPAICLSDTSRNASSVYLTPDEKNNPVISWCETDHAGKIFFYLSFLDTAAGKFYPPINIPVEQNASLHEEGMPKVAIKGNGSIVAVYEISSPTKENQWAGQVRYIQSFDKGKTWTSPHAVHADTSAWGSHSFAAITRLSNGEIGACWLDQAFNYKKSGRPVKFASTHANEGFANEVLVDSIACECCRLAIAASEHDKVSIVYRDIINDSIRDISISTSFNNGQSFSIPTSFSDDYWNINGCPHNGPGLVNTQDATYAVWFTGGVSRGVYYGELNSSNTIVEKKQIAANGRNIQLSLLPDGSKVVVYSENVHEMDAVYSRIRIKKIENGKVYIGDITPKQAHAAYPVINTYGSNNIIVAWAESQRICYMLLKSFDITNEILTPVNPLENKLSNIVPLQIARSTDPVCGMAIADHAEGTTMAEDTTMAEGKVIGFCSKHCKEKFLCEPHRYLGKIK
ncbi:MAG: exo-alpha-sialidase [Agriterribacter sp.]